MFRTRREGLSLSCTMYAKYNVNGSRGSWWNNAESFGVKRRRVSWDGSKSGRPKGAHGVKGRRVSWDGSEPGRPQGAHEVKGDESVMRWLRAREATRNLWQGHNMFSAHDTIQQVSGHSNCIILYFLSVYSSYLDTYEYMHSVCSSALSRRFSVCIMSIIFSCSLLLGWNK